MAGLRERNPDLAMVIRLVGDGITDEGCRMRLEAFDPSRCGTRLYQFRHCQPRRFQRTAQQFFIRRLLLLNLLL